MTSETARRVEVPDVVGVRPPVYLHVGEDGGLIDVLKFNNGSLDRGVLAKNVHQKAHLLQILS
jgi:hypothetical protein